MNYYDEILNGDLTKIRFGDGFEFNWGLLLAIVIGSYLLIFIAVIIRVLLKCSSQRQMKETVIDKSLSTYRRRHELGEGGRIKIK